MDIDWYEWRRHEKRRYELDDAFILALASILLGAVSRLTSRRPVVRGNMARSFLAVSLLQFHTLPDYEQARQYIATEIKRDPRRGPYVIISKTALKSN